MDSICLTREIEREASGSCIRHFRSIQTEYQTAIEIIIIVWSCPFIQNTPEVSDVSKIILCLHFGWLKGLNETHLTKIRRAVWVWQISAAAYVTKQSDKNSVKHIRFWIFQIFPVDHFANSFASLVNHKVRCDQMNNWTHPQKFCINKRMNFKMFFRFKNDCLTFEYTYSKLAFRNLKTTLNNSDSE